MHMLRRREGDVAVTMSSVGKQLVTIEPHKWRELQKEGARNLPIQPMAMPGGAADSRPARARPAQSDGELRGADAKANKEPRRGEPEDADFADIHAGLAPAEARPEPSRTAPRAELRAEAIVAAAPLPAEMIAPEAAAEILEVDVPIDTAPQRDSSDMDAAPVETAEVEIGTPKTDVPAQAMDGTDAAAAAIPPRDPLAVAAPLQQPAPTPDAPEAARADAPPARAVADAPPSAPRTDMAAAPPPAAQTTERMTAPAAPSDVAPVDQPKIEAVAAAETTARRAEAALDRRSDLAATPSAPPPGAETVQAVRQAPPPVAVPQGAPQPVMADARAAEGEISIAAAADRALAEADTMGFGAGSAERAAAAFSLHAAPAADRSQAAAAMAQMAPTLRKGADGTTEIRLDPPELGRVRLTLRTDDNGLVAIIQAERPETMDMMRRNADMLMRDLMAGGQTKVDLSFGSLGAETGGGGKDADAPKVLVGLDRPAKAPGADLATQLRLSRAAGGLDIRV